MAVFLIFILLLLLLFVHLNYLNLYSLLNQNKIKNAYSHNFGLSLSLLPYFNTDNEDYREFYKMIDFIAKNEPNKNIFKRSKISVKITHLAKDPQDQWILLQKIVNYAKDRNVFVWISTVLSSDRDREYAYYKKLKQLNYKNVGLTLSTYHKNVSEKVDAILRMNGHIRLVKGYYYGDIPDWNVVTQLYYENAIKLIQSNNYHTLATHDFQILNKLRLKYPHQNHIELAFFYSSLNYVLQHEKAFKNHKSLYISYGNIPLYLYHNIFEIDLKRIMGRTWGGPGGDLRSPLPPGQ